MNFKTRVPVTIPEKIYQQIQYLCSAIPKDEWSGVLFYKVTQGDVNDLENMKIEIKDILPMDKGNATYTSYELDDRVADYVFDVAEFTDEDWLMGHIHSHNTMDVFFSKTDDEELEDNAPNHNFYLSLIVNNFMEMTAKIAILAKAPKEKYQIPYQAKTGQGEDFDILVTDAQISEKLLGIINCDIIKPEEAISVTDDFANKVDFIIKDAEKPAGGNNIKSITKKIDGKNVTMYYNPSSGKFDLLKPRGKQEKKKQEKKQKSQQSGDPTKDEAHGFLKQLMGLGSVPGENETLEEIIMTVIPLLEHPEKYDETAFRLFDSIYDYHFGGIQGLADMQTLAAVCSYCIDDLEYLQDEYPSIEEVILQFRLLAHETDKGINNGELIEFNNPQSEDWNTFTGFDDLLQQ